MRKFTRREIRCDLCGEVFFNSQMGFHRPRCSKNPNREENLRFLNRRRSEGKTGKPLSEEHRLKISEKRIKFLEKNPDKVPYLINHSSKESWPEKIFKKALEDAGLTGWVQGFRAGIYEYDFAFVDLKVDVEVDGYTHRLEKVKKIDQRRDNWSKSQGWKVIRFEASDVKKDASGCIDRLKQFLGC